MQHLQSAPAPAGVPAAIDTTDASRSERLLLLLLDHLGVALEAVRAACRGQDRGGGTGAIHSEERGLVGVMSSHAPAAAPNTQELLSLLMSHQPRWADRFHLQRPVDLVHLRERMTA